MPPFSFIEDGGDDEGLIGESESGGDEAILDGSSAGACVTQLLLVT